MSRTVKYNGVHEVAYGNDHVVGNFIQVFEKGIEDPIVDRDGLTPEEVKEIAREYGVNINEI